MEVFGEINGKKVECIRLNNDVISAEIITYGAALRALRVPDGAGRPLDVVLGFDDVESYVNHTCYFGAVVGPVANRIGGAACRLGDRVLRFSPNDGPNCNHSGPAGLNRVLWEVLAASEDGVTLLATHPDGLGGFPGDLRVAVTYWLEDRDLAVEFRAVSDRDTLCNLINHSCFNLDGHDSGSVLDHRIKLWAGQFTPTDPQSVPTGEVREVRGTAMDLREPTRIGDRIDGEEPQLRLAGGYDHSWVLEEEGFHPAAQVWAARSGLTMQVWTDRPALQFYTGNYIPDGLRGKAGAVYNRRQGLCLETQGFPDAPNHPSFPSITLRAGKAWQSRTAFRFW